MHKHRKTVCFTEQIIECFNLAAEIQNSEIATVFVTYSGHVNILDVAIHYPHWQSGVIADEDISFHTEVFEDEDEKEQLENYIMPKIKRLREILASGADKKKDEEILAERARLDRLNLFMQLQKEFECNNEADLNHQLSPGLQIAS